MTRHSKEAQLAAAGVRPGASAAYEYHLVPPSAGEFGDLRAAAALVPLLRDPQEEQALHQWQNALQTLRRALTGRRR